MRVGGASAQQRKQCAGEQQGRPREADIGRRLRKRHGYQPGKEHALQAEREEPARGAEQIVWARVQSVFLASREPGGLAVSPGAHRLDHGGDSRAAIATTA